MESRLKKAILVVDDDETVREFVAMAIEFWSGDSKDLVIKKSSVEAAKACFGMIIPDLVITDLEMPGESGWDLVDFIRKSKIPELACVPIVVVSGKASLQEEFEDRLIKSEDMSKVYILKKPLVGISPIIFLIERALSLS